MRIFHTADLHLDAPFPALGEGEAARKRDFLLTFERMINLAIRNEVHLFVVAGDLFDSPRPSTTTVAAVQSGLKRLVERGIHPVLLPGTHDGLALPDAVFRRETFPGTLLTAATVSDPPCLQIDGVAVYLYGFAYRSGDAGDPLDAMVRRPGEGIHLGLLHGSRKGSPEWDHRKKDLPFDLNRLKEWNLDYVALGHYHAVEEIGCDGRTYAAYPGSPEGKRFGENGPRHALLVTVAPGRATVERLVVNSRSLEELSLDVSAFADEAALVSAIGRFAGDKLVRLTLTGIVETPLALERLRAACAAAFFHLELIDQTRLFVDDLVRRFAGEESVRGLFLQRFQERMATATAEEEPVLEQALREVLVRFAAPVGRGRTP
ncbi:MAG: hypothetical protein A2091_07605 [Desulfuromonadales bacterium GWD2_61_12]|nr:MAG: hypothetical protein A2005_12435 [Desulfuromonadales bacterium GWC2_61_20]OGR33455.1 MAG: hypothetical protein A2091_07605 [Desulfuromonadales bacterium GWD2_61_12]